MRELEIEPRKSFGKEPFEPIVHTWMPAASVYFHDPDGNSLEFIALLNGDPLNSGEVLYLSEWLDLTDNTDKQSENLFEQSKQGDRVWIISRSRPKSMDLQDGIERVWLPIDLSQADAAANIAAALQDETVDVLSGT